MPALQSGSVQGVLKYELTISPKPDFNGPTGGETMKKTIVIISTAMAALLFGCGREYHVRGRVVAFQGTGAASTASITEITGREIPETGASVQGAEVTLFYELGEDGTPREGSTWKRSVITDEKGIFDIRDYSVPSMKLKVGLRVSREGFGTAYTTYWDYKEIEPQVFLVHLVPRGR
jgi:hypothetical protein